MQEATHKHKNNLSWVPSVVKVLVVGAVMALVGKYLQGVLPGPLLFPVLLFGGCFLLLLFQTSRAPLLPPDVSNWDSRDGVRSSAEDEAELATLNAMFDAPPHCR